MDISTDTIIFYRSFYEAISKFKDSEQLELYKAVFALAFDNIDTTFSNAMQEAIFTVMRPNIMANIKNQANGKKGGRPSNKPKTINENSAEVAEFVKDYQQIKNADFKPTESERKNIAVVLSEENGYEADYWRKVFRKSKAGFLINGEKIACSLRKILLEHNAIFRGEANLAPDEEEKAERKQARKQAEEKAKKEELSLVETERKQREEDRALVNSPETAINYLNKYLGGLSIPVKQISSDYKDFKKWYNIALDSEGNFYEQK